MMSRPDMILALGIVTMIGMVSVFFWNHYQQRLFKQEKINRTAEDGRKKQRKKKRKERDYPRTEEEEWDTRTKGVPIPKKWPREDIEIWQHPDAIKGSWDRAMLIAHFKPPYDPYVLVRYYTDGMDFCADVELLSKVQPDIEKVIKVFSASRYSPEEVKIHSSKYGAHLI